MVLIPAAIWIYALVFAFSSLWFSHFCLQTLQQLRQEQESTYRGSTGVQTTLDVQAHEVGRRPANGAGELMELPRNPTP